METLTKYLAVAAGGAVGTILRYYMTLSGLGRTAQTFPLATFVINITGSFIDGFFLTLVTERISINPHIRLAGGGGLVGAYTTFSTFEYGRRDCSKVKTILFAFLFEFRDGFGAVWAGHLARQVEGGPLMSQQTVMNRLRQTSRKPNLKEGSLENGSPLREKL